MYQILMLANQPYLRQYALCNGETPTRYYEKVFSPETGETTCTYKNANGVKNSDIPLLTRYAAYQYAPEVGNAQSWHDLPEYAITQVEKTEIHIGLENPDELRKYNHAEILKFLEWEKEI